MNRYIFIKDTTVYYKGIIEANSYEEAQEIAENADLDECFTEEGCTGYPEIELVEEEYDLPIFRQTKDGYELVK